MKVVNLANFLVEMSANVCHNLSNSLWSLQFFAHWHLHVEVMLNTVNSKQEIVNWFPDKSNHQQINN